MSKSFEVFVESVLKLLVVQLGFIVIHREQV